MDNNFGNLPMKVPPTRRTCTGEATMSPRMSRVITFLDTYGVFVEYNTDSGIQKILPTLKLARAHAQNLKDRKIPCDCTDLQLTDLCTDIDTYMSRVPASRVDESTIYYGHSTPTVKRAAIAAKPVAPALKGAASIDALMAGFFKKK